LPGLGASGDPATDYGGAHGDHLEQEANNQLDRRGIEKDHRPEIGGDEEKIGRGRSVKGFCERLSATKVCSKRKLNSPATLQLLPTQCRRSFVGFADRGRDTNLH
jgi:hypothetical protein